MSLINIISFILIIFLFLISCYFFLLLSRKTKQLSEIKTQNANDAERLNHEIILLNKQIANQKHEVESLQNDQTPQANNKDFTLKRALKRSEEANFLKNAFLSNISQEIRTPLNNIIGFSSLLEAEISLLENKELFDYAKAISESGDRLLHLLNNIIDISKLEANDMQLVLKSCNVNTVLSNATQLFIFKANEQKLKLNLITNEVPEVLIDEKGLTKVITCIIDNAIKFTKNGFINISTEFIKEKDEISIRVKDTGIGIDPSYLPSVFDPFRHDSLGYSTELQGAGLGLPLAKSMIELMRGRIEIESSKGIGTTVTIFFPSAQSSSKDNSIISRIDRKQKFKSLQGLEIFIVEDDLMNKIVLYEMTKSLGNVVSAVNGDETLRIIADRYKDGMIFDIMLFDINLPPPWDGTRLMQEIRKKWTDYKTIPFVAQTAYAMAGDKEKLLEAGFDDYISKPINQQELYSIIKNQLNKL